MSSTQEVTNDVCELCDVGVIVYESGSDSEGEYEVEFCNHCGHQFGG